MLSQASAAMFTCNSYATRQSKCITRMNPTACRRIVTNPNMNSAEHVHYLIDLFLKCFWQFDKRIFSFLVLWSWKKVSPHSPLSIVVESGLISFWLKFLTAVIIPERILLSHTLSPFLLRWAKWLRCGDREWFVDGCRDSSKRLMHI